MGGRLVRLLRPEDIHHVRVSNGTVRRRIIHSAGICVNICVFVFTFSVLLVTLGGFSLVAGFATITTALGGVNPNLSLINPDKGFSVFSSFSGLILVFSVLTKHLRLFPLLLLFMPGA